MPSTIPDISEFDLPQAQDISNFDLPKPQKRNKSLIADAVTATKIGVERLPSIATGIGDLVTAPLAAAAGVSKPIDKAANWLGEKTGFQPSKWADKAKEEFSPATQQAQAAVDKAEGFFPTLGAIADNPRSIVPLAFESLPSTVAGGAIGRLAMPLVSGGAAKLATTRAAAAGEGVAADAAKKQLLKSGAVAGGIGEGVTAAGQPMSQISEDVDPLRAAGASLGTGAGTALLGAAGGRLAARAGLVAPEAAIAAGTFGGGVNGATTKTGAALNYGKRIGGGAIAEGVFEEMPQSAQEQAWQNFAEGRPLDEGVGKAAAQGLVAGTAMGGAFNAMPRGKGPETNQERILREVSERGPGQPIDKAALDQWASGYAQPPAPPAPPAPPQGPSGSFSDMNEFADLIGSERADLEQRRQALKPAGPLSAAVNLGAQTGAVQPQGIASVLPTAPTAAPPATPATPLQSVTAPTTADPLAADPLLSQAAEIARQTPGVTPQALQDALGVGFNRASRLLEQVAANPAPATSPDATQSAQPAFDRAAIFADIAARTVSGEIGKPHKAAGDILLNAVKQGIIPPDQGTFTAAENDMLAEAKRQRQKPALPDAKPLAERSDEELRAQFQSAQDKKVRAAIAGELQRRKAAAPQKIAEVQPVAAPGPQTVAPPAATAAPKRAPTFVGGEQPKTGGVLAQMPTALPLPNAGKVADVQAAPATVAKKETVAPAAKAKPQSVGDAIKAEAEGAAARDGAGLVREERDAQARADKASAWKAKHAGNRFETIAARDIVASDHENLAGVVRSGKVTAERAVEMIDDAAASGVLDAKVAGYMKQKVAQAPATPAQSTNAAADAQAPAQPNPRAMRAAWRTLGRDVSSALPENASRLRPQPKDFIAAAKTLGISPADAALAWNVFSSDDTPTPSRQSPVRVASEADRVGESATVQESLTVQPGGNAANEKPAGTQAAKGEGKEAAATHKDPGQPAEAATAPVVAQAVKKSARNTDMSIKEAREWLLGEVDKAIIAAGKQDAEMKALLDREKAARFDVRSARNAQEGAEAAAVFEAAKAARIEAVRQKIGYVEFDVPGDGKFKVLNAVDNLTAFRDRVKKSPGFSANPSRPMRPGNGMAGGPSLEESIAAAKKDGGDGLAEIGNEIELARLRNKDDAALQKQFKSESGGKSYDDWRAEQEARESAPRERKAAPEPQTQPAALASAEAPKPDSAPEQKPADKPADQDRSELAKVPPQVQNRLNYGLKGLRDVERRLNDVIRARGRGQILALELKEVQDDITKYRRPLDAFRRGAKEKGIDAEAVIRALGGEPGFAQYGEPAADDKPATNQPAPAVDQAAPAANQAAPDISTDTKPGKAAQRQDGAADTATGQAPQLYRPAIADFFASLPNDHATAEETAAALAKTDLSVADKASIQRVQETWMDTLIALETKEQVTIKC